MKFDRIPAVGETSGEQIGISGPGLDMNVKVRNFMSY
jgi:hypothetical protein